MVSKLRLITVTSISSGGDTENLLLNFLMYFQTGSTNFYHSYPKLKSPFLVFGVTDRVLSLSIRALLKDDVTANFQFQRLGSY